MKKFTLAFLLCLSHLVYGQNDELPEPHEILDAIGEDGMRDPELRMDAVAQIRLYSESEKRRGLARARALGLPEKRFDQNGRLEEVIGINENFPLYRVTHNANAAISSGANIIRTSYSLSGYGLSVGLWDGGSARLSHQEFGGRVTSLDGAVAIDHATHVAGTLAASGVQTSARGMAPSITVDSYDWNNDLAEMTFRGATEAGQVGKIYLSNHSYGIISGWNYVNSGSPSRVWEWWGNGTLSTSAEEDFGRYNTQARDQDSLAYNAPYYLIFRSAGNERVDTPTNGQLVALSPGSSTVVAYDSATHPSGDGSYRGGYETVAYESVAKNVITVGAVNDAVSSGSRAIANANMTSFSSWGPTDDGRIKPDIVANGASVYSSTNGGDAAYASYNGTSMATPSAAGTAALLIQHYENLFPNQAMRSSTLKALLIHSADDRGNLGPDYQYGWGLINSISAAGLITDHQAYPAKKRLTEGAINNTNTVTVNHEFVWDGVSPIRATLCWTDPSGTATTTADLRTARLRNNLNLKIIGPDNSEFFPYVMPFVGTWTQASMSLPAVTGINNTDNVEQVLIAAPPSIGVYRAVISYSGTLTNNSQNYSLLLSGSANETPPPPPLEVSSVSPSSALPSPTQITVTGIGFTSGTAIKLTKSGEADIEATGETLTNNNISCSVNLSSAAAGNWDIVATNPNNESVTLANSFTIIGAIWSSTFDSATGGWNSTAETGTNSWVTSTTKSKSPNTSYFCAGPMTKSTTRLISPTIAIPAAATNLQLRFWHDFVTQLYRDGGRLEFSLNGGTWFSPGDTNSGASFATNGYNSTITASGQPQGRSAFAGLTAWSGNSNGFVETVVNLTDTTLYAGKSLRLRFSFATDSSTASTGWYVDSIALAGGGNISNAAPQIIQVANTDATTSITDLDGTSYDIVPSNQANLSVLASDDGSEGSLTYTWGASNAHGNTVSFLTNGNNAAKNSTVFFEATGDYMITVTATDAAGSSASSAIAVRVQQSPSSVIISPSQSAMTYGTSQLFSATLVDQFDQPMTTQPSSFQWSSSAGSIDANGLFTGANVGGPYAISASHLNYQGASSITVSPASLMISLTNLQHAYDGTGKSAIATTDPPHINVSITYDGSSNPPILAGNYSVMATSANANYQGQSSALLTITDPYDTWKMEKFTPTQINASQDLKQADPDGDGLNNWMEYHLSLDPNDANSKLRLSIAMTHAGQTTLTINQVVTSGAFHLQSTTDLQGNWLDHPTLEITQQQSNFPIIFPAPSARMFYRLVYTAPPQP